MSVSDEDKALFHALMQTVKPLKTSTRREPTPAPEKKPIIIRKPMPVERLKTEYYLSNHYTDIVSPESTLSYCSQSLPHKRLRELKSGKIRWEARLDLHGLRPDDAQHALCSFVTHQYHQARRCVLIIHGKGGNRHGEAPVLKNHVNHWLQQLPQVLAFHSALPRDGGNGALYVLLKRLNHTPPLP
ncbi:MAG TPA: DNA mismatch repair protein MutS [Legionella sp.]|nr:DNA mismatch repair protein MutS [Legionella sp.]